MAAKDEIDLLNREHFINEIVNLVTYMSKNKKGSCFSIEGSWGIGKTFVLENVEKRLRIEQSEETNDDRFFIFHYNCWQFDYYEEPAIAIISAMLNSIIDEKSDLSGETRKNVNASIEYAKKNLKKIAGKYLENKIGVNLISIVDEIEEIKEEQNAKKEFDKMFGFKQTLDSVKKDLANMAQRRTIILVVDELDRCIPEYAIKVLERLHHMFYGIENVIVIMALDRKQLEYSVEKMFGTKSGSISVEKYLKKFIDFSVALDNGVINSAFKDKYSFYYERFEIDTESEDLEEVNKILPILFEDIDIRSQEKIIDKANIVHSLIMEEKADVSLMIFELIYEVFQFLSVQDLSGIIKINDVENVDWRKKIGAARIDLLRNIERKAWRDETIVHDNSGQWNMKNMLNNLNSKIMWIFANVFNSLVNPYSQPKKVQGIWKEVEIKRAKKYCEYRKMIM